MNVSLHWKFVAVVAAAIVLKRTSYGMLLPMCNITSNVHNARIHGMHTYLYIVCIIYAMQCVYKVVESEKLNYGPDLFVLLFSTFFFALHLFGLRWTTLVRSVGRSIVRSIESHSFQCKAAEPLLNDNVYFPCVYCVNEWYSFFHVHVVGILFFFLSFVRFFLNCIRGLETNESTE